MRETQPALVEMLIQVMMRIQATILPVQAAMYREADVRIVPEMMQDLPEIHLRMMQVPQEILLRIRTEITSWMIWTITINLQDY
jgi:hypothetical protein